MRLHFIAFLSSAILLFGSPEKSPRSAPASASATTLFGFRDASAELANEKRFLAAPDAKLAEEHLRTLTQAPHMAGTVEDKATADYVAQKFREAGLDTEIVEYKVWINYPLEISVDQTAPAGVEMHGPRASTSTTILFRMIRAWSCPSTACRLREMWRPMWSMPTTALPRISKSWRN
jgi:hypothetical protein